MFIIIGIMFAGVLCGWLLRRRRWTGGAASRLTMPLIFLLLFVMGIGVGGNDNVMDNLPSLGGKALIITLGAVLGSLVAGKLVYRFFFRNGGAAGDKGGSVEDKGSVTCGDGQADGRRSKVPSWNRAVELVPEQPAAYRPAGNGLVRPVADNDERGVPEHPEPGCDGENALGCQLPECGGVMGRPVECDTGCSASGGPVEDGDAENASGRHEAASGGHNVSGWPAETEGRKGGRG